MYRVMMTIDGEVSPSSCIFIGNRKQCHECVRRMIYTIDRHPSVNYAILPCVK